MAAVTPPPPEELNRVRVASTRPDRAFAPRAGNVEMIISSFFPPPAPNVVRGCRVGRLTIPRLFPRLPSQELDVLLATEDNTVREEAAALLVKNTARVASERLAGTTPNGAPVYDKSETIDGHEIQTSATPPLRTLLSTPALPEELVEHLPKVESPR